jgi:hypothetical protein
MATRNVIHRLDDFENEEYAAFSVFVSADLSSGSRARFC